MSEEENQNFSLHKLEKHFKEAIIEENVHISAYLLGYEELNKFLVSLGTIFSWIASDVGAKINNLKEHLRNDPEGHSTLKAMIQKESPPITGRSGGLRNLLRLHRALEYIYRFLESAKDLKDDKAPCGEISQEVYNETLAKHHSWLIQQGALMAMRTLPNKKGLLDIISSNVNVEDTLALAVLRMKTAYDYTQKIYETNGFLNLP